MSKPRFDEVWKRVVALAGDSFATKTGLPFTYRVEGNGFFPSRTKYRISSNDFRVAFDEVPYAGPSILNTAVRGPAYIWAVLHDSRIRCRDW
jgi:hypothetical protein